VKSGCARADSEGTLITHSSYKENSNPRKQTFSREKITRRSPEAGEKIPSSPQRVAGVFRTAHFLGNEPFGKDRTLPRNLGASSPSGNVRGKCRGWISFFMDEILGWKRHNTPAKNKPKLRPHSFPDPSCGRRKSRGRTKRNPRVNASSCRVLCLHSLLEIGSCKG
jgi:hypothetical protein